MAIAVTAASAARQPQAAAMRPPPSGAATATRPRPDSASDITRAPSEGWYRSRTMARAHITTAASAAPWAARQATSMPMDVLAAAPRLATAISVRLVSSTGRRPQRSDAGPHTSCIGPNARISTDIVSCVADSGALNSPAMAGSDGRYRSVITGCRPSSSASITAACAMPSGARRVSWSGSEGEAGKVIRRGYQPVASGHGGGILRR